MAVVQRLQVPFDHELVVARPGPRCGYRFIIAIHSSLDTDPPGRAAGGCRLARYEDPLAGLHDALRLSQAMSRKAAIAGTRTGGGKCVIAAPAEESPWPLVGDRREAVLRDLAEVVGGLDGRYMTGPDVGTTAADMEWVHTLTPYAGGFAGGGTADGTAVGVYACLTAAARHVFGSSDLRGRRITIVGLGGVGEPLARLLAESGAQLRVTDIDPSRQGLAAELGALWVAPEAAQRSDCEILVPCALGGTLTADEVGAMTCRLVVGAANNQLASDEVAELMHRRGIAWVPDFVANAGGLLYAVSVRRDQLSVRDGLALVRRLGDTADEVLRRAELEQTTTLAAAIQIADERLQTAP
ncbi:MAG TPA: Glu/Leu/Phe/Val dehydrogenase dimerization domain-containing protein [Solirubrobacteraceae bacterium]|jgi:leucine dehydrogenase